MSDINFLASYPTMITLYLIIVLLGINLIHIICRRKRISAIKKVLSSLLVTIISISCLAIIVNKNIQESNYDNYVYQQVVQVIATSKNNDYAKIEKDIQITSIDKKDKQIVEKSFKTKKLNTTKKHWWQELVKQPSTDNITVNVGNKPEIFEKSHQVLLKHQTLNESYYDLDVRQVQLTNKAKKYLTKQHITELSQDYLIIDGYYQNKKTDRW